MENKKNKLTAEGYEKLMTELNYLRTRKRQSIIKALRDSSEYGDLRENSEFDAARDSEHRLNERIKTLEHIIYNAEVIDKIDNDMVCVGSTVEIKFLSDAEICTYRIVGPLEAEDNSISYLSPLGSSLLNKKVGNIVSVSSPSGSYNVEIISIY